MQVNKKVLSATRLCDDDIGAFRCVCKQQDSSAHFLVALNGDRQELPVDIAMVAYNPETKKYLGLAHDGVTWLSDEKSETGGTIGKLSNSGMVTELRFFHGRFWCVGSEFEILSSDDGLVWKNSMTRTEIDVVHHRGIWTSILGGKEEEVFAAGLDGIIGSFDGSEWSLDRIEGTSFFDICVTENHVYICGSEGNIAVRVEGEWQLVSTDVEESFISFYQIDSRYYLSTETRLFEFSPNGASFKIFHIGRGGHLFRAGDDLILIRNTNLFRLKNGEQTIVWGLDA